MGEKLQLCRLPGPAKKTILAFLALLTAGVLFGMAFLFFVTGMSASGTTTHFAGDALGADGLEIPAHYPMPVSEMLITTHNHLIGFALIFAILAALFYTNTIVSGRLRNFLLVEPFICVLLTFVSMWGIRFVGPKFAIVTMVGGILTYLSYFTIVGIVSYELLFKSESIQAHHDLTPKS